MTLSRSDISALKAVLDQAIIGNMPAGKLSGTPGARNLGPDAKQVLQSVTQEQINAFRTVYQAAKARGATDDDLRMLGPIF